MEEYTPVVGKRVRDFDRKRKRRMRKTQQTTEKRPAGEESVKGTLTNVRGGSIIRVFFHNKNV